MTVPLLPGIAALADRYDGFILDLWGVLHDGQHPLPGAVDALERLHGAGKHIVILSNAPRRAAAVIQRIAEIGIRPGLYDALLSSGEATWNWLDGDGKRLGKRLYPIMAARDDNMLEGLPVEVVQDIEAADFILNTGVESAADKVEDFEAALVAGVGRGLPMVCANPDLMVIHGGKAEICAGAVALRYEQLGGKVHYFGKPHRPIYDSCFELLVTADRTVHPPRRQSMRLGRRRYDDGVHRRDDEAASLRTCRCQGWRAPTRRIRSVAPDAASC